MPDVRTASGFRSLVEQIQENGGDEETPRRPVRRRLSLPGGTRERAPQQPAPEAAAPVAAPASGLPLRLLQRRWL